MYIEKRQDITKDERKWIFETRHDTYKGTINQYNSKNVSEKTKNIFLIENKKIKKNMNIKELYELFYLYQKSRVKTTTLYTYSQRNKYLKILENVKLHELTVEHYKLWRNSIDNSKLSINYKNNILKFFKELLKYAERWYGYDFRNLYNKFDKFRNPNVIIDEEINYYTYEEFKKFISVEKDLKYKVAFEILYYCGLRRGELLALTWNHINFENKVLSVKQNLVENRIDGG